MTTDKTTHKLHVIQNMHDSGWENTSQYAANKVLQNLFECRAHDVYASHFGYLKRNRYGKHLVYMFHN